MQVKRVIGIAILTLCTFAGSIFTMHWYVTRNAAKTLDYSSRLLALGHREAARDRLGWLLYFESAHPEACLLAGTASLQLKRYEEAINFLKRIPPKTPESFSARAMLVAAFLADYQMESAESELRDLIRTSPNSIGTRIQLSGLLCAQERCYEAAEMWRSWLANVEKEDSNLLQALHEVARTQFHQVTLEKKIAMLEECLIRHPGQQSVRISLALILIKLGRVSLAEGTLGTTQIPEADFRGGIAEALIEINNGNPSAAVRQLSVKGPPEEQSHLHAYWDASSLAHEQVGSWDIALEHLEKLIQLDLGASELRIRRARLLKKAGKPIAAASAYEVGHRLAEARLKLWKATRSMTDNPRKSECKIVADLYDVLGEDIIASAWRHAGTRIASDTIDD